MADDMMQGAAKFRAAVERVAERLTSRGPRGSRQDIADLAEDLVRDVLGALSKASIAEIAETVASLNEHRRPRATASNKTSRRPLTEEARRAEEVARGKDPFDITMPSELLDQAETRLVASTQTRREDDPPASVRRVRGRADARVSRVSSVLDAPQTPGTAAFRPTPEPVALPRVALREGEQLVRSSVSGVVIRRIRTA